MTKPLYMIANKGAPDIKTIHDNESSAPSHYTPAARYPSVILDIYLMKQQSKNGGDRNKTR